MAHRPAPIEKALRWLLNNQGREGHWFWKWKFRTVDRAVQFNPDKYGWPWFPGTVSWVIPTAFSLIALKQSAPCCRTEPIANRIQLGTEMLRDRACPQGGWNAGNGIVFGSALTPHIDTTAIALLALTERKRRDCRSRSELATPGVRRLLLRVQPCLVRDRIRRASRSGSQSLHRGSR